MIRSIIGRVGRARMIAVAAILVAFFAAQFAILGSFEIPRPEQAQARSP